ncbi:uncharacterized protein LOC121304245 [Polyodon spathula]|uniref:uncharacterized protein LOC121304245 n=1 Tax=Polyodon spathula TaxID=7913 RepID=UPI001B7E4A41|nr:uncharacterized protein LOC121304245 [Polyodon spathula]
MGSFASFWVALLLVAGESASGGDDEEKFTVAGGTFTLCPNQRASSLSRWLSERSNVSVSLWLLGYTGLERNVWCEKDSDAECRRGVSHSINPEAVSSLKDVKYNCLVSNNRKGDYKKGFTLIALRGAASHSNPVPEGSSLTLTCWGLPEVQRWEWTHNNIVISDTSKYINNANISTLTIRSVEKTDGGTYRCKLVFQRVSLNFTVMIAGPGPDNEAVVRIVVPVVLVILVMLGIGAFCVIKRKRSQAQESILSSDSLSLPKEVNGITANPVDGDGNDPKLNYATVNLNNLPSSARQPGPVTKETVYSQVKVN